MMSAKMICAGVPGHNEPSRRTWCGGELLADGSAQRLADFGEELLDLEGFEEDGLEAFLAGADDAVVGVVAEAGHEDDGEGAAFFAGGGEDVVAGLVGHLDVGEDEVEFFDLDLPDGFSAVGGR